MKAFTLVETLVAIAIITLAVLAPFSAIEAVLKATHIAKDQAIASALAQEGLEYVRFIRDNNYLYMENTTGTVDYSQILNGLNGTGGSGANCTGLNKCTVDTTKGPNNAVSQCPGVFNATCPVVYFNSNHGWYDENQSDTPTGFTRSIQVNQHTGYETVTSTVTWTDYGSNQIKLAENLYDWI